MDTVSLRSAKEALSELVKSANAHKKQFRVISEEGNVVILPEETYNNILVTLEVLSTPGLMKEIDFSEAHEEHSFIENISKVSS